MQKLISVHSTGVLARLNEMLPGEPPYRTWPSQVHTTHLFGPLKAQKRLDRGEVTWRIGHPKPCHVLYRLSIRNAFQWKISGVSTKTVTGVQHSNHIFPMDKSVLRLQCVFQVAAIKQPEGNVTCTWTEFQTTTWNFPSLEKHHPPRHCCSNFFLPLNYSSSNNRGKQTLER